MQTSRHAITTGLLVLGTLAILIAVLVVVGMPGVLNKLNTFQISYDNANGIRPGAPVLLAGREIGKVTTLESPVPMDKRPEGYEHHEVLVTVQVSAGARVYDTVTARLGQQGLMGQQVIDFVEGKESSGLAANDKRFVGERVPEISEAMIDRMTSLAGPDSDLAATIKGSKVFMQTLNDADIQGIMQNTKEFTDTIKTEPWRVLWPGKTPPSSEDIEPEKREDVEKVEKEKPAEQKTKQFMPTPRNR
ncbi:MAG: MlaD family protein [Terrimicrobiaceae bacterium]